MRTLYIIKVGTTFPATYKKYGDFDRWTTSALAITTPQIVTIHAEEGEPLPKLEDCAGAIVTGSHSMVTDNLPWSVAVEKWLLKLMKANIPIFGICYGHQLLAKAAGGHVDYHPGGKEIGTVRVQRLPECDNDFVFQSIPDSFLAHVTHSQSVLELPKEAVRLASNDFEPNHAFRLGENAYGAQFHPEYTVDIMRSYIEEQTEALTTTGRNVQEILNTVRETPDATGLIKNFAKLVQNRLKQI